MSLRNAARPHSPTSALSAPYSLLLREAQNSHAPQRIVYRWKALALRYTMMQQAMAESAHDRCDDNLIATITHACAAIATMVLASTARARVNGMSQI